MRSGIRSGTRSGTYLNEPSNRRRGLDGSVNILMWLRMDGSVGPGPGPGLGLVPGPGPGTHDSAFTSHEPNESSRCQLKASNDKESRGGQNIFPRPMFQSCARNFVSLESVSNCNFEKIVKC